MFSWIIKLGISPWKEKNKEKWKQMWFNNWKWYKIVNIELYLVPLLIFKNRYQNVRTCFPTVLCLLLLLYIIVSYISRSPKHNCHHHHTVLSRLVDMFTVKFGRKHKLHDIFTIFWNYRNKMTKLFFMIKWWVFFCLPSENVCSTQCTSPFNTWNMKISCCIRIDDVAVERLYNLLKIRFVSRKW